MNLVRSSGFLGPGGFRLFLASLVVIHHSFPFRAGSWAVYVFFILSGYWITRMWYSRYVQTRNSYFTFLVSRWWRLAPVFFLCIVLGFWSGALTHERAVLSLSADPGWWLRQIPIAASTGPIKALPPSWSVDIEMQFYLLAPLAIYLVSKISAKVRWPLVAILLLLPSILLWQGFDIATPPYLAVFSGFFMAGIVLALSNWVARSSTIVTGVVIFLVGSALLVAWPETRTGIWYEGKWDVDVLPITSVWWVLGAILVVPFVSRNVRVRSSRLDRFLGNLAYPVYLFHWIAREWYYHFCETDSHGFIRIVLLSANVLFAFIGATLILVFVGQPLDRLRTKWVRSQERRPEAQASTPSVASMPASDNRQR